MVLKQVFFKHWAFDRGKQLGILTLFLFFHFQIFAQVTVHVKIPVSDQLHLEDSVFVAGSFNKWDPAKPEFQLKKKGDFLFTVLTGQKGDILQFKFTRGSWKKVEADSLGNNIEDRLITLSGDTSLELSIKAWKDDFSEEEKTHTLSSNVGILDTAFFMPQLNRTRRIWIYLPPGYSQGFSRYPVIYMHDGQNLFDNFTAGFGEWGVDECLDSLIKNGKAPCIVVGIDYGPQRLNEYNPYDNKEFGKGEGEQYVRFIAETLKPFIDKHYRTIRTKNNTTIAGSSMGGLISYYAVLEYPDVFGKAGIFSPSFWIAPEIGELTKLKGEQVTGQLFFVSGELESKTQVDEMKQITDLLGQNSSAYIYMITDPEGRHNEKMWRSWFKEFYLWVCGNGTNYQVTTGN